MKKLFIILLWLLPFVAVAQIRCATKTPVSTDQALQTAEKMPQYPGGEGAMYKFIYDNVEYPAGIHKDGPVFVRFIVSKTGKVEDVKVIKGLDDACDAEAVRVVKMMPDWTPGQDKGEVAPVFYIARVTFKHNTLCAIK